MLEIRPTHLKPAREYYVSPEEMKKRWEYALKKKNERI